MTTADGEKRERQKDINQTHTIQTHPHSQYHNTTIPPSLSSSTVCFLCNQICVLNCDLFCGVHSHPRCYTRIHMHIRNPLSTLWFSPFVVISAVVTVVIIVSAAVSIIVSHKACFAGGRRHTKFKKASQNKVRGSKMSLFYVFA